MGLDMYLYKHIYVGAQFEHRHIKGIIDLTAGKAKRPIKVNIDKVSEIIEQFAYWRKANQIHKWFVDNVQDEIDDCGNYNVTYEQLVTLRELCKDILKHRSKAAGLLPVKRGFFFGNETYGENYFDDLKRTVEILKDVNEEDDYYYHSSW